MIATLYEPCFNSSYPLVRLLLKAPGKVDVWAVDTLRGWCALDYAREYEALLQRLGPRGFSGEDVADYRAYVCTIEASRRGGAARLSPEDWLLRNPPDAAGLRTPALECLAIVQDCIKRVARHLGCPASVFAGVAPGACRRAFDKHVAAVGGAAGAEGGGEEGAGAQ